MTITLPIPAVNERQWRYAGWRVVAASSVGTFCGTIPIYTFAVFLRPVTDQFSWSREAFASAYGALALIAALSAPWLGSLLDRLGARRVIVPCLALSGCAVVSLSALTSSIWHLRVVFGAIGLATMGASPIAYSRAIFGWFDALRGRALGVMLAGAAICGIVMPPIAQGLIRSVGWRIAWLLLGSTTLVVALPTAIGFIADRRSTRSIGDQSGGVSVRLALRSRIFRTVLLVVFSATLASNGAIVHIVALLADRGVPLNRAALAISAIGAASLVGRLFTGWLLDRAAPARVSVLMLTIGAIGAFLLAAAHSLSTGIAAAVCIGFGSGGELDVIPYLLARAFGLRSLSTLYGFNWTAWGLAGAAGPIVVGRAFDTTGSYTTALVVLGCITLVAAGLMMTLPALPSREASAAPSL